MNFTPFTLCCRGRLVTFERPAIMGILNVTEDSFYDGGRYTTPEAMVAQARNLLQQGADIIDIGAVSSRPGAKLLAPDEEADRLAPVVKLLRRELPEATLLSVDTCYSLPAQRAVEAGADIVNDISGGQFDTQMFPTVAALQVPYILMHTRGLPATMQNPENTRYDDIVADLARYFSERLDALLRLGVKDIILDPGFGFAKTVEQNYELLDRLDEIVTLFPERPLLAALSNKSMISKRLAQAAPASPAADTPNSLPLNNTELGTLALNTLALYRGARLLRVHTPSPTHLLLPLLFPTQS